MCCSTIGQHCQRRAGKWSRMTDATCGPSVMAWRSRRCPALEAVLFGPEEARKTAPSGRERSCRRVQTFARHTTENDNQLKQLRMTLAGPGGGPGPKPSGLLTAPEWPSDPICSRGPLQLIRTGPLLLTAMRSTRRLSVVPVPIHPTSEGAMLIESSGLKTPIENDAYPIRGSFRMLVRASFATLFSSSSS